MLLTILLLLLAADLTVLIYLVTDAIRDWNRQRQRVRIQRVQQELAETQQQLQTLALRHDAWLRDQAHEARKALIMESFHASKEARVGVYEEPCCTNHNDV